MPLCLIFIIGVRGNIRVAAVCRVSPWRGRNTPVNIALIYNPFPLFRGSNGHAKARPYSNSGYR